MHAASLTWTPQLLRTAVATSLVLFFVIPTEAQDAGLAAPETSGHYEAAASWTLQGEGQTDPQQAVLRWTQIDDQVVAFTVLAPDALYTCHGTNGSKQAANETRAGACSVQQETPTIFRFTQDGDNQTWEGMIDTNVTTLATIGTARASPSPIPGFIVALLTALFFLTTLALAILYVRERRMAHYLVRRLYEETKGRMPADWPENMRQQWIARIFIRGKN